MKFRIFILIVFPILTYCHSTFKKKKLEFNSCNKEFLKQIQDLSYKHLYRDSTIGVKEFVSINKKKVLLFIKDSTKILSIPIEGHPVRKDYILFLVSDKKVYSSIRVNGNWINNDDELGFDKDFRFLSHPLIYLEDITNDGFPELIIKDRMHNGNLFNVSVKHIFSLNNLNLKYVGAFEYISHLPFANEFLIRYWNNHSKIVSVYLKKELHSKDSIMIGSYNMDIQKDSLTYYNFKISSQKYDELKPIIVSLNMEEY